MNLEDISSIEVKRSSSMIYFVIAGIFAILGLYLGYKNAEEIILALSLLATVVCALSYIGSRKKVISICSKGSSRMNIPVNKMSSAALSDYLDRIAQAKNERLKELTGRNSIHLD